MSSRALEIARAALGDRDAWLVGGAVRDRRLERSLSDIDVVVDGDPGAAARALAAAARERGVRVACFALSERFGAWRVATGAAGGSDGWQVDVEGMRGGSLEADLGLRDFTVNAIAEPIGGGGPIDPLGGLADLAAGRLRLAGAGAFVEDPLRVLRLVRVAVELALEPDPRTLAAAREQTARLASVSPERVFAELRRILACERAVAGLRLMSEIGAAAVVLPELEQLRGVQQSRYHHRDVHGHTLETIDRAVQLTAGEEDAELLGPENAGRVRALLAEPLADGLSRGEALRWGALLHDIAKPATRAVRPIDRRVTFMGHDVLGAQLAREVLGRLRASVRLREHVAGLVRWHLRLGFLVHEPQPLRREQVYDYLRDCQPVEVDVTLLSVCDRLATRGADSETAIRAHLTLAGAMLGDALRWREQGPPRPLWRGDELAAELKIATGPRVGELLAELARAQFAGGVSTREQALELARRSLKSRISAR